MANSCCTFQLVIFCCGHPGERIALRKGPCSGLEACKPTPQTTAPSAIRQRCSKCSCALFFQRLLNQQVFYAQQRFEEEERKAKSARFVQCAKCALDIDVFHIADHVCSLMCCEDCEKSFETKALMEGHLCDTLWVDEETKGRSDGDDDGSDTESDSGDSNSDTESDSDDIQGPASSRRSQIRTDELSNSLALGLLTPPQPAFVAKHRAESTRFMTAMKEPENVFSVRKLSVLTLPAAFWGRDEVDTSCSLVVQGARTVSRRPWFGRGKRMSVGANLS